MTFKHAIVDGKVDIAHKERLIVLSFSSGTGELVVRVEGDVPRAGSLSASSVMMGGT